MKTALKALVTGLAIAASSSVAFAQSEKAPPMITVTAGQAGYIIIPDTRPQPQRYALTGEPQPTRQSSKAWQQSAGPVFTTGQSQLLLPASR